MCDRFLVESILREVVFTFQELELRTRRECQNGTEGLTARAITRHAPINIHVDLISHGTALAPTFVVLFHLLSSQVSVCQPPSKDNAPLKPRVNSGMYLMSAKGHKPSFYLRIFDRLLCDVKQPLCQLPGVCLRQARSGHLALPQTSQVVNAAKQARRVLSETFGALQYRHPDPGGKRRYGCRESPVGSAVHLQMQKLLRRGGTG